jgi:hypothetical protein
MPIAGEGRMVRNFVALLAQMGLGQEATLRQSTTLVKHLTMLRLVQGVSLHCAIIADVGMLAKCAIEDVTMTEKDIHLWGLDGPRIEARWFGKGKWSLGEVRGMFKLEKTKLNGCIKFSEMKPEFLDALEDTCWRQRALDGMLHVWGRLLVQQGVAKSVDDTIRTALQENHAEAVASGASKMKIICKKALVKWHKIRQVASCLPGTWQ